MSSSEINDLTGPIVLVLVLGSAIIMYGRILRHLVKHRPVPLLLKRDALIYTTLSLFLLGAQYVRYTGNTLGNQVWWTVATNALTITALIVWLGIEVGFIGKDRRSDEDRWS